ncbi:MAG: ATP-binding protein [Anaerolineae bacterium]
MNLYQKGLLAFAIVILVAIVVVAIFAGYRTETAFRRYAVLYSGRIQMVAEALEVYYVEQGTWAGLQEALPQLTLPGRGRAGRGNGSLAQPEGETTYLVANAQRNLVASTEGAPEGHLSTAEVQAALPLVVDGETVGYLLPTQEGGAHMALDEPAAAFLTRLRWALALGGGTAFLVALLMAGLLTRSIVRPVRELTQTAETVAQGKFDVRVEVKGEDEIGRLATTFNEMAAYLERAERARRAQTADIAHELRNPLAVLQSTLEALADGVYPPTEENIEPALDQVQTLNRLVEDLRTLALADAGQLQLDLQPLDLGHLAEHVTEAYRDSLREQGVTLLLETALEEREVALVLADYARVTQVLNNILGNVARYVPAGSTVRIKVASENRGGTLCVADNGPGISEELLPRLFERFWRGDPSRSRATGGSGLGLAIAHQIIKAHSGRIWAEPTPGGGLTICFWLPSA